jgi:diacylglycerol kinase (ATP)
MIPKKTGFRHLWATVGYAFDGFMVLIKESAFKHEVMFLIFVFTLFALFKVVFYNYVIAVMLWCVLIAVEAINTAIEHIVDRISPEISDFAKKTKDLGSLAVFLMIAVNIMFVGLVLTHSHY